MICKIKFNYVNNFLIIINSFGVLKLKSIISYLFFTFEYDHIYAHIYVCVNKIDEELEDRSEVSSSCLFPTTRVYGKNVDTNLVKVIHSTRISSPRHPIFSNRLKDHTLFNALFETTVLTPVPLGLCDFATTFRHACVHSPILYSPFEETFTPAHT